MLPGDLLCTSDTVPPIFNSYTHLPVMSPSATTSAYGLTVKPLRDGFGAEVEGVDFSKPVPSDLVEELLKIQTRYAFTVYRSTQLDNDRHVAFASQLGKQLEKNPFYAISVRLGTPYLFDVGK